MKSLLLFGCLLGTVFAVSKAPKGCFRAATLDHVQQFSGEPFAQSEDTARDTAELNLKMYEKAAEKAAQNDIDIIQFPEGGIQIFDSRKIALVLGEHLPKAPTDFTYCSEEFLSTPILKRLACIAQKNRIFVSANMLDVQPFEPTPERNSSRDNALVYNTQVVFDREGRLIAKYHKMHLFNEPERDVDFTQKPVVVDTELGRLGLNVCFDLLFATPGHKLAKDGLVDTILYPTWWLDELPFLQASQIQSGFAYSHNINLIASNIHTVERFARGSGIYAGNASDYVTINDFDSKTKLLIANLPIHPGKQQCEMNATKIEIPQETDPKEPKLYKRLNMMKTPEFKIQKLDLKRNEANISFSEDNYIYCQTVYQSVQETINDEEEYYLIAGNRTKPGPFPFNEQFCAVVQCPKNEKDPCAEFQQDTPLKTRFNFIMVNGGFMKEVQVFPSIIGDMHQVVSPKQNNVTIVSVGNDFGTIGIGVAQGAMYSKAFTFPIGTIGMYGRDYRHDLPLPNIKLPLDDIHMPHD